MGYSPRGHKESDMTKAAEHTVDLRVSGNLVEDRIRPFLEAWLRREEGTEKQLMGEFY